MVLSLEATVLAELTGVTLNINQDLRDVSTKDSAGWRRVLEGRRSWSVSAEGMYVPNGAFNSLYDAWLNRTTLTARIASTVSGDDYFEGECMFASGSLAAPGSEDNCTWDVSFEGDGALTLGAVA
jgi:predicted secreted protein